ncbi:hypothetical protein AAKU55_002010 [Oxalobacteraceae bacterium GrIS 1.11]
MKKLSLIFLLLLGACGGDGGTSGAATPPTTPGAPDAFYAAVLAMIDGDGDSEPAAIDTLAASAPENTEPLVLK